MNLKKIKLHLTVILCRHLRYSKRFRDFNYNTVIPVLNFIIYFHVVVNICSFFAPYLCNFALLLTFLMLILCFLLGYFYYFPNFLYNFLLIISLCFILLRLIVFSNPILFVLLSFQRNNVLVSRRFLDLDTMAVEGLV